MRLLTQEDVNKVLKAMEESFKAYEENDGSEAAEERIGEAEGNIDNAIIEATNGEIDPYLAKDLIRHPYEWNDDWSSKEALEWKKEEIRRTLANL